MARKSNQNPEQIARDRIDDQLIASGWSIQDREEIDLDASLGVAVREYPTDVGPADYVLFVDRRPVGVVEAKKPEEGQHLSVHEVQSQGYAKAKLKHLQNDPLPFVYEATGVLTRFTDYRDPKPRARKVFTFHRPETFLYDLGQAKSLRNRLQGIPALDYRGLRTCQTVAITNLEASLKVNKPRALVQMATGAGKTFTAITSIYRLLKFSNVRRVLFLVDTRNLGEQAEQEFMAYTTPDDGRKFTELYSVQRLSSGTVAKDSQVVISTIQRIYSILKGEELKEGAEDSDPNETSWNNREPLPVVYSPALPIEFFDVVVIDECHRSIYNLWRQVLDYFDAFQVGLSATPDKRTFGYFNENVVSEYTYENSVVDGVNVGYDVYVIDTHITNHGSSVEAKEWVDKREKLTRRERREMLDEALVYSGKDLDRDVVNLSQIRNVIRAYRDALRTKIFPNRTEVPKTLVFAKTDSHADDIIKIIREEFDEGNDFCKKVTYQAKEDPKTILAQFRNSYNPRIAVTVDMIATGTDIRPLEVLLFMRDVKSSGYFEQMKGRGTRSIKSDDLLKVTPSAKTGKTHFVLVDAVGVTESCKTDSRPLEKKKSTPLKDLLQAVAVGAQDRDLFESLASRLTRLHKQMTDDEKGTFHSMAGVDISAASRALLDAYDPDAIHEHARVIHQLGPYAMPNEAQLTKAQEELIRKAAKPFTGKLNEYVDGVRKVHEQVIDTVNIDTVITSDWSAKAKANAQAMVQDLRNFLLAHKDEITALSIYYDFPARLKEVTYDMVKEVATLILSKRPDLAPQRVWSLYAKLEGVQGKNLSDLVSLVSLLRCFTGRDPKPRDWSEVVDANFHQWMWSAHKGKGDEKRYTEEQMEWLRLLKEHIATSFHVDRDDLEYAPFDAKGGLSRMYALFGVKMDEILNELNEKLVA